MVQLAIKQNNRTLFDGHQKVSYYIFMNDDGQTISDIILEALGGLVAIIPQFLPRPLETKHGWAKRLRGIDPDSYSRTLRRMKDRGLIKIISKNDKKFIELTNKGQLQALLNKASLRPPKVWDGKWRLFIFDIPESSKDKRNILRQMLKNNNFFKLQASVYINPYPLNREALAYLKKSGLIAYIRILKVEEIDDDSQLLKRFGLKNKQISDRI